MERPWLYKTCLSFQFQAHLLILLKALREYVQDTNTTVIKKALGALILSLEMLLGQL